MNYALGGEFSIAGLLTSNSSIVVDDKSIIFYFKETSRFCVISSNLALGFPLSALIDRHLLVCYVIDPKRSPVNSSFLFKFGDAERKFGGQNGVPWECRRLVVLTGDANFAHVAWNQLSALEISLRNPGVRRTIVTTHQPLGRIEELIDVGDTEVCHIPDFELSKLNDGTNRFVSSAAALMSEKIRKRVLDISTVYSQNRISNTWTKIEDKYFLISIRSRNRTAENFVEFAVQLCSAILNRYSNINILLDGHSLPADIYTNKSYSHDQHFGAILADRALADAIEQGVEARIGPSQRVVKAIGLDIRQSLAFGAQVVSYFAHHGTVQHKIGWFHQVNGIVHSNRQVLNLLPAKWVSEQVEDGTRPVYIPEMFISDIDQHPDTTIADRNLRTGNYLFERMDLLQSFVLDHIEGQFTGR